MIKDLRKSLFLLVLCSWHSLVVTGQVTWRKTYGGQGSNEARCVRQVTDGGYVVLGSTGSFGAGGGDIYFLRLSETGDLIWSKTYGDPGVQQGVSCRELPDGYILAGTTSTGPNGGYDMVLIRTDLQGEVVWERSYGTTDWDICNDLDVLSDGFVFGGMSYGLGSGAGDAWVLRTDLNGDTIWTATIGGVFRDEALGIDVTGDGGVIVSGSMGITQENEDGFLSRLSPLGILDWTTEIGGDSADYLFSAVENSYGEFACSGSTKSYSQHWQILHAKVDATGDSIWEHHIGTQNDYIGAEIQLRPLGGYVIAGSVSAFSAGGSDMYLLRTAGDGWFVNGKNYGGSDDEAATAVASTADGGFVTAGYALTYGPGIQSAYVVKGDSVGETFPDDVIEINDPLAVGDIAWEAFTVYPNPSTTGSTIQLAGMNHDGAFNLFVIDSTGRIVRRWQLDSTAPIVDLHGLTPGLYELLLIAKSGAGSSARIVVN